MTIDLSDTEEKAFKVFGVLLICVSIFSFVLAFTGSDVYREGTVSLDSGKSVTRVLEFDQGQTVFVGYNIIEGKNYIIIFVEIPSSQGGVAVGLDRAGTNKAKFVVNETQTFHIYFTNVGSERIVFHFEIEIEGYNENSVCYSVSFISMVLGIIILIAFFKEKFI